MARKKFDLGSNPDNLEELARALERLHAEEAQENGDAPSAAPMVADVDMPTPEASLEYSIAEQDREVPSAPAAKRGRPTKYALPLPKSALLFRAGMVVLSLVLLVILAKMIFPAFSVFKPGGNLQVPNIVGQQQQAIEHIPRNLRVELEHDATSDKPAGTILKLTPPPGTRMKAGGKVTVTIAGKGGTTTAATTAPSTPTTEDAGDTPGTTTAPTTANGNAAPANQPGPSTPTTTPATPVTPATTPSSDTTAAASKRVTISGDVVGMSERQARAMLEPAGVQITTQKGEDTSRAGGVVIATSPAPGTEVGAGETVTLTINDLSRYITIRNYQGRDGDLAADDLKRLGFAVTIAQESGGQRGYVTRTDPPSGTLVQSGSSITVYVGQ